MSLSKAIYATLSPQYAQYYEPLIRKMYQDTFAVAPLMSSTGLGDLVYQIRRTAIHFSYFDSLMLELDYHLVDDELEEWGKRFFQLLPPAHSATFQLIPLRHLHTNILNCLRQELQLYAKIWYEQIRTDLHACNEKLQQGMNPSLSDNECPGGEPDISIEDSKYQTLNTEVSAFVQRTFTIMENWMLVLLSYAKSLKPPYFVNLLTNEDQVNQEFTNYAKNYHWVLYNMTLVRQEIQMISPQIDAWLSGNFLADYNQRFFLLKRQTLLILDFIVSQSLIITQQPQATIKKETKFKLEGRIIRSDYFQLDPAQPLELTVLNQEQAQKLYSYGSLTPEISKGCGDVVSANKTKTKSKPNEKDSHTFTFDKMSIPSRPNDGTGKRAVLKQKFYILFHTEVLMEGRPIKVWTCSSPFVYTTNVSQDIEATATIFWDMCVFYKTPFRVENYAKIYQVRAALARYIEKETDIDWAPSKDNLDYLIQKISGSRRDAPSNMIARAQIDEYSDPEIWPEKENGKDNGKIPSFWQWFRSALRLVKDHLHWQWKVGNVIGFIDRDRAEEEVGRYPRGAFIVRFMGSREGQLSVTYCHQETGTVDTGRCPPITKGSYCNNFNYWIGHNDAISWVVYRNSETKDYAIRPKSEAFESTSFQTDIESSPPRPPNQAGKKPYAKGIPIWTFDSSRDQSSRSPEASSRLYSASTSPAPSQPSTVSCYSPPMDSMFGIDSPDEHVEGSEFSYMDLFP